MTTQIPISMGFGTQFGVVRNSTLTTPLGPINWNQSSDGTIRAQGGGQTLTITHQNGSDGSWQSHSYYARTGSPSYLTMDLICDVAGHTVEFTIKAGSSQLTLAIAGIDAQATSGTATLSGTWNGAAVHWTGHADLTTNPLVTHPIAGWPKGAFASELQQAAFFNPLGNSLAGTMVAAQKATTGTGGRFHKDDKSSSGIGVAARAAAWCGGAALAASETGPGALLACAGGAGASVLSDLFSWIFSDPPTQPVTPTPIVAPPVSDPPVSDPPVDDPPVGGPVCVPGDGLDGEGEGGGGGGRSPIIDQKPPQEED